MDESVLEEIEVLKAILMEQVTVVSDESGNPERVEIMVHPSTADDSSSQYVRVTLVCVLPKGYPEISPTVSLRNPRGLDDSVLQTIACEIKSKLASYCGAPVIFELIEVVKEHLTEKNVPSCQCVICLYGFSDSDHFTKTQCYHYFHSHCLASHITNSERIFAEEQEKLPAWQQTLKFQRQCPVCREVIAVDMELLSSAAPPVERESARTFELDEDLKLLQLKMAALFKHQQSRGGIIDLEAEESKLLLVTNTDEETIPSAGPSLPTAPAEPIRTRGAEPVRRGLPRNRGHRGAFSAQRKNRGHHTAVTR